jgi:hypothetical protein
MVADLAVKEWRAYRPTDHPKDVPPSINRFTMRLNDYWSDDDRQLLVQYIPKVVGLSQSDADEQTRRYLALDWCYRTAVPAAFRLAKLDAYAERLAIIAPIVDQASWSLAWPVMNGLYEETRARRTAWREDLRKQIRAAAAEVVAVVAAEVAVEAEEVAAEVAAVEIISRTLAGAASKGSLWPAPIVEIVRAGLATLPKDPSYGQVQKAVYGPVRDKMRELLTAAAGPDYVAYRRTMRDGALDLLDRMIAVGQREGVAA